MDFCTCKKNLQNKVTQLVHFNNTIFIHVCSNRKYIA